MANEDNDRLSPLEGFPVLFLEEIPVDEQIIEIKKEKARRGSPRKGGQGTIWAGMF